MLGVLTPDVSFEDMLSRAMLENALKSPAI